MSCRIGCDLLAVAEVRNSLDRFGDHYLRRVYTPHEVSSSGRRPHQLAARFAAKEAVIKVLRPADTAVPLNAIEVQRREGGWCEVKLSGPAAALAEDQALGDFQVSLSHEADYAIAVVHATVFMETSRAETKGTL